MPPGRRGRGRAGIRSEERGQAGRRNSSRRPPVSPSDEEERLLNRPSDDGVSQDHLRKSTGMKADRTLSSDCRTKIKFVLPALDRLEAGVHDVRPSRSLNQHSRIEGMSKSRIPLRRVLHQKLSHPSTKSIVARLNAGDDWYVGKSSTRGTDKLAVELELSICNLVRPEFFMLKSINTCSTSSTPTFALLLAIGFHLTKCLAGIILDGRRP